MAGPLETFFWCGTSALLAGGQPIAAPEARETCFAAEVVNPSGQPYGHLHETEHFAIHWEDWVPLGAGALENLSVALEDSLRIQTEELGFRPPDGIDAYSMVVVVEPLGSNVGGYSWMAACDGGWMPYLVLNLDLVSVGDDSSFLREVVAHELFHTIQFAYGLQEFFLGWDSSPNRWWIEASASYQQGVVVPEGSDWLEWFSTLWSQQPWKSIETHDPTGFQYGSFVFPLSVEGDLGQGWHREIWEQLEGRAGYRLPDELDAYFQGRGTSLVEQWATFLSRGAEGTFPRYDFLLGVRDLTLFAQLRNSTTDEYTALDLPVEGSVLANTEEAPEYLGANYVWFGLGDADPKKRLVLHFSGDAEAGGEAIEWVVELVAVRSGEVRARYSADPLLVDGQWEVHARLDGIDGNFEGAYLIASPTTPFEGSAGWGWAAELRNGTTDDPAFSEADAGRGCSEQCQTSRIDLGALPLIPLIFLARRRRRPRRLSA